jgi:hypothetical protein
MIMIVQRKERSKMVVIKKQGVLLKKKPETKEVVELTLPTSPSEPSGQVGDYSILIYGEKKIGKTTLASQFEKAFFMMCEPGGKALKIYQRPVRDWNEFKKYVSLVCKDKQFKTVVIDTIDNAYKMCVDYICKKLVIADLSEEDWGLGWRAARDEFTAEITKLLHYKGVIFLSHAVEREIKKRDGTKYHKISPTMSGQAKDFLEGIVDIWAYYFYEDRKRFLLIEGNDHVGAGHRVEGHFRFTDGTPVVEIPMGTSSKEAHENFIQSFNNQLQKGEDKGKKLVKKVLVVKKH